MTYVFENGVKTLIKHGKGIMKWPEGSKYIGELKNDFAEGKGVFYHANGDMYIGELLQDKAHGYGAKIKSSGRRYEGYWEMDFQNGPGLRGTRRWLEVQGWIQERQVVWLWSLVLRGRKLLQRLL